MIKIGLAGAGFIGQMHSACYAATRGVKLVAVADVRRNLAEELAKEHRAAVYTDAGKMFTEAGLHVADICLPTNLHCEFVVKAARAGLHVLCEKPIATTIAEANRMIRAAKKASVQFMIAQVIRFWPEYMVLKQYVDEGELGKLISLQMTRLTPRPTWTWKNWVMNPKLSGGVLTEFHIHDADFVRYLLGEPRAIQISGIKRRGVWDHIFVNYIYKNVVAQAEGGWDFPQKFPFCMSFRALFERGILEYNSNATPTLKCYPADGGKPRAVRPPKARVGSITSVGNISDLGGYYNEIKYFVDCLRKGQSPAVTTPEDARESLGLVLQELRAAERSLR